MKLSLLPFLFASLVWTSCGEKRPDEPTRRAIFAKLESAEKRAEKLAFDFIQGTGDPHAVENVETYRSIRRDSSVAAWDRIMEAEGWARTWADSIWSEGLKKHWSQPVAAH